MYNTNTEPERRDTHPDVIYQGQTKIHTQNHSSSPHLPSDLAAKYAQTISPRPLTPPSMMPHMQREHARLPTARHAEFPQDLTWRTNNSLSNQANVQVQEAHNAVREYEQRFSLQQSSPKNKLHSRLPKESDAPFHPSHPSSSLPTAGSITHGTASQHPMQRPGGSISMGTAVPSSSSTVVAPATIPSGSALPNYMDHATFARFSSGLMEQQRIASALYGQEPLNQLQVMQVTTISNYI